MDPRRAKILLTTLRPHPGEAPIDAAREAREMAASQPEVGEFLRREEDFDREFSAALARVEPPAGLRERLLALDPERAARGVADFPTGRSTSRPWWQPAATWGAAAALLAGAFWLGLRWRAPAPPGPDFSLASLAELAEGNPPMQALNEADANWEVVRTVLRQAHAPVPAMVPRGLQGRPVRRYAEAVVDGRKVSLIACDDSGVSYLLCTFDMRDFPDGAHLPNPVFQRIGHFQAAVWTCPKCVYVLLLEGTEEQARAVL